MRLLEARTLRAVFRPLCGESVAITCSSQLYAVLVDADFFLTPLLRSKSSPCPGTSHNVMQTPFHRGDFSVLAVARKFGSRGVKTILQSLASGIKASRRGKESTCRARRVPSRNSIFRQHRK